MAVPERARFSVSHSLSLFSELLCLFIHFYVSLLSTSRVWGDGAETSRVVSSGEKSRRRTGREAEKALPVGGQAICTYYVEQL